MVALAGAVTRADSACSTWFRLTSCRHGHCDQDALRLALHGVRMRAHLSSTRQHDATGAVAYHCKEYRHTPPTRSQWAANGQHKETSQSSSAVTRSLLQARPCNENGTCSCPMQQVIDGRLVACCDRTLGMWPAGSLTLRSCWTCAHAMQRCYTTVCRSLP